MNLRVGVFIAIVATVMSLQGQRAGGPAAERGKPEASPPLISCSPATPIAKAGGQLQLNAWAIEDSIAYTWSVPVGTVKGRGSAVVWELVGVEPGEYAATVQVRDPRGRSATCQVQVFVVRPTPSRNHRETGRSFLLEGQQEAAGFGLYSYVLFGIPPVDELSRQRYLEIVKAYSSLIGDMASLEKYFEKSKLNVTYLPLTVSSGSRFPQDVTPEWILEHYNYDRARYLLRGLPGGTLQGAYIISYAKPLTAVESISNQYLKVDLSGVYPGLVPQSVKEFLNQAAREHYWENSLTLTRLALNMRNVIAGLARAYKAQRPAMKELEEWIAISKM